MRLLVSALVFWVAAAAPAQPTVSVTVEGPGFLRFVREGRMVYAKKAVLSVVKGRLAEASGVLVVPAVTVPASAKSLAVGLDGSVIADGQRIGQIVLAVFESEPQTPGLFSSPDRPGLSLPGDGETGVVRAAGPAQPSPVRAGMPKPVRPADGRNLEAPKPVRDGRLRVLLKESAEVDGAQFTIGDVADVEGPTDRAGQVAILALGDTPPLGIQRTVDTARIFARLKAAGIDASAVDLGGAPKSTVSRKGQTVTHEEFVQAAVRGAQSKGFGASFVASNPGPDMKVPVGRLELVCETVSGTAELSATVAAYVDGKRFNARLVRLTSTAPSASLQVGSVVNVKVSSKGVAITVKAKVLKVMPNGQANVQVLDTGAQLVGTVLPDGSVEVKA